MILGIDMGGTNIDGVALKDGKLLKRVKRPVDRERRLDSVLQILEESLEGLNPDEIKRIHLSTTVCTNAIVEGRSSKVGLVLQTGPGMLWDYSEVSPHVAMISGSVDHRGKVVKDFDRSELEKIKKDFKSAGLDAIAVVTKFSTRNPEAELSLAEYFGEYFSHVTMGHSLSGRLNFPRRVQSAYLNAAVASTFAEFSNSIKSVLKEKKIDAPVYILKADGGTLPLEEADKRPVETILSGPAASFMGVMALLPDDKIRQNLCLIDIGGTTTDIFFLVDGIPVFEPDGIEIDGRKTLLRALYSRSVGLGGDSEIRWEDGELQIGPQRLGNALAFGGSSPTPTDALVVLGQMQGNFPEKSEAGLAKLAAEHDLTAKELAQKIVDRFVESLDKNIQKCLIELNSRPVTTIRELLSDKSVKVDALAIIGGPANALSTFVEKHFELPVSCPAEYEVANAIGAALSKPTLELNLLADTERGILSIPELDFYESIQRSFNLQRAKEIIFDKLRQVAPDGDAEILDAESFNMVQSFHVDKNIRVKAQIKPALLMKLV